MSNSCRVFSWIFFFLFLLESTEASGCPDRHWFTMTNFPLVTVFRGGAQRRIAHRRALGFHFPREGKKVSGPSAGKLTPSDRPELSVKGAPPPPRPAHVRWLGGRRMADPNRNWESAERDQKWTFSSSKPGAAEAGAHAATPTPRAPLASQGRLRSAPQRSLPAREEEAESWRRVLPASPRVFAPNWSSHLLAPQEEQDASSAGGAATGSDISIASDAASPGREGGGGTAGGQGAGGDVTAGAGLRGAQPGCAFPSTPAASRFPVWVWPRGGICCRCAQWAATGSRGLEWNQNTGVPRQLSIYSQAQRIPVASKMMGLH